MNRDKCARNWQTVKLISFATLNTDWHSVLYIFGVILRALHRLFSNGNIKKTENFSESSVRVSYFGSATQNMLENWSRSARVYRGRKRVEDAEHTSISSSCTFQHVFLFFSFPFVVALPHQRARSSLCVFRYFVAQTQTQFLCWPTCFVEVSIPTAKICCVSNGV